jgi:purine-binding chemotaxis protein CheW
MSKPPANDVVLLARVGNQTAAIPLPDVIETMRPLPIEWVAGDFAFVKGVAIVRGQPLPVVDLRLVLCGTATGPGRRFVTVRIGGRPVALLVDDVVGFRELDRGSFDRMPPLLENRSDVVSGIEALDQRLVVLLQGSRRLLEEVDRALAEAGAAR